MRDWHSVSTTCPCSVCGKGSWCTRSADGRWAVCRRLDNGAGLHRVDRSGGEFWLYCLLERSSSRATTPPPSQPDVERADPVTLDRVYGALLQALPLSTMHLQALGQRGLDDTEIARRRYSTLPLRGRATLARRLVDQYGEEVCGTVPGFCLAEHASRRWWSLAGAAGLLIQVRNLDGHIVALKMRADDPGEVPKYTYLSSAKHGGPGPGAQVHVPVHDLPRKDVIRITEGELKSDVSTVLSGVLSVSIPGVGLWEKAIPMLEALHPRQVLIALDSDWRTNGRVALAIGQLTMALLEAEVEVLMEDWYPALGKGIDDVLAQGHVPTLRSAAFALGGCPRINVGSLSIVS